jgi:hypothetical protein
MFALFAGEDHYPSGGWDDLVDMFDTVEAAEARAEQGWNNKESTPYDWYQIVDLEARRMVVENGDYLP